MFLKYFLFEEKHYECALRICFVSISELCMVYVWKESIKHNYNEA